jgi:hypothetical protein
MTVHKVIPTDEEGFDLLLQSLDEKCPAFKTTLNISDSMLDALQINATCYHELRLLKDQFNDTKVSLTEFIQKIFSAKSKDALPTAPTLTFTLPVLPGKPGIEEQTKKFIEYLELQDDFTDEMGLNFGFYVETSGAISPEDQIGNFKVKDFSGYRLDILFALHGQDGFKLSYRVKGEIPWTIITLITSPYTLQVPPDPDGLAITLEMKGDLIKNNKPVGQTSDVKTVIAHA